jgi:zinc-binding alcohol dehydrogenase family protein
MKAVGYQKSLPIGHAQSLLDITQDKPKPAGHDLLVQISAISVNPVDTKVRMRAEAADGHYHVLGWDAAGTIVEKGADCSLFEIGDEVFYAGALNRPGTNSEFHLVDERIVAKKPQSISNAEAAALPLTSITAWEVLFDRLDIEQSPSKTGSAILIIGGAGGVGSIAIQIAKALTGLTVVATASRPETKAWVQSLGADHVIDHSTSLVAQWQELGIAAPDYIFSTTQTDKHYDDMAELIAPQGRIALIDDPDLIDIRKLKRKSVSIHWELMFTRSLFSTPDMIEQHHLLTKVAELVDKKLVRTTLAEHFGKINATNVKRAHSLLESGKSKGKIVLEGF